MTARFAYLLITQEFPKSTFTGFDVFQPTIDGANQQAEDVLDLGKNFSW